MDVNCDNWIGFFQVWSFLFVCTLLSQQQSLHNIMLSNGLRTAKEKKRNQIGTIVYTQKYNTAWQFTALYPLTRFLKSRDVRLHIYHRSHDQLNNISVLNE